MPPVEIIEKRTRNSKTYWLGENRYRQEFHVGDIHYKDSDGYWQGIDANYSEADGDGFTAKFTKLPFAIRMGDDGRRRLYPDRNDLFYWIEIGKPFASMGAPTKEGGYWVWDYPSAAISLMVSSIGIKLNFTLKNSNAPTSISFPFAVQGITRDGNTLLHNGKPVVILAKPSAVDAEGTERDVNVSFSAGEVTLSLDTSGLVFPIDVDSTELVVQPSSKDTYFRLSYPDNNYGGLAYLTINDDWDNVYRGILEFDISGLPSGATLDSASFQLYYGSKSGTDPSGKTVWAYKLTRTDWVESEATWNSYKSGSAWTDAGGDYVTSSPSGGSTTFPASYGWVAWNVLAIVQDAYDNTNPAEFLVKFEDETLTSGYGYATLYPREYTTDPDLQPTLVIEYEVAAPAGQPYTSRVQGVQGMRSWGGI